MLLRRFFREVIFVDINNENDWVIFVKLKLVLEDLFKNFILIEFDNNINRY